MSTNTPPAEEYECCAAEALYAADAHDQANGIHCLALSEATVERAARDSWNELAAREGGRPWDKIGALNQARWVGNVGIVLAAAVKEGQA
ncbi:hypothetical protein [Arthrobacter bambusae]|uniref:Uncharacterized protein n=1 Tax=Arthrobacter bambusae TaxID=1338426 RepID=A0AAW8D9C5_9MICC|nr:hypothetical protein [Arthrobacter bambusae]MDP9903244.1 hypothetical protein [Arthrobacter bambusae]MDQ0128762.1 hypothetical protein [Arthrobacter bambusae]MDQ0180103.1 hypothetical protein [Arthrobacter bambusae]